MTDIITAIAVACVPLLGTWIASVVIPWIKARTTAEQRKNLMAIVRTAVRAAQQMLKDRSGEEKRAWVEAHVRAEGVTVSDKELRGLIEEAVLEIHIKEDWAFGLEGIIAQSANDLIAEREGLEDVEEGAR